MTKDALLKDPVSEL